MKVCQANADLDTQLMQLKALRWRIDQLIKRLIKKITLSS